MIGGWWAVLVLVIVLYREQTGDLIAQYPMQILGVVGFMTLVELIEKGLSISKIIKEWSK